ncbi:hypothetical protein AAHE18_14G047300 [Arachis hypogaea]
MNCFLQFFHTVWRWEESERSETRRVWLECFGIPLHTWSVETFNRIGGLWGEVIKCDERTESALSFSSGRVLIDTCVFDVIKEWVHLTVGTSGFDVFVKEVGHEVYGDNSLLEDANVRERGESSNPQSGEKVVMAAVWDPATEIIMERENDRDEDKGRMVTSDIFLNECNQENSKQHQMQMETGSIRINGINGEAACARFDNYDEADSERTNTDICIDDGSGSKRLEEGRQGWECVGLGSNNAAAHLQGSKPCLLIDHAGIGLLKEKRMDCAAGQQETGQGDGLGQELIGSVGSGQ